ATRMTAGPAWLPPEPIEPDYAASPTPSGVSEPHRPRRPHLPRERRARVLHARALESEPPERFGFSVATATWLFTVTTVLYRWYFRTQCFGIENLPPGPVMLVAN